jgi:hypothetical protein
MFPFSYLCMSLYMEKGGAAYPKQPKCGVKLKPKTCTRKTSCLGNIIKNKIHIILLGMCVYFSVDNYHFLSTYRISLLFLFQIRFLLSLKFCNDGLLNWHINLTVIIFSFWFDKHDVSEIGIVSVITRRYEAYSLGTLEAANQYFRK